MPILKPWMLDPETGACEDGSLLVATNPAPGTAFADNIQAAFSDTVPFAYLANNDAAGQGDSRNLYLRWLKLIVTVVPATATAAFYAIVQDVLRPLTTNNMTAVTPVCANGLKSPRVGGTGNDSPTSAPTVLFQSSATASAITASSGTKRVLARGALGGLPIVGDELCIVFGDPKAGAQTATTAAEGAGQPGRRVSNSPAIIAGPQQSLTVHLWFPGNATTGLSYEFELGMWMR